MNTPTIVSAALSDKELQDSINRMVANFDKGLQDMLDHTNKKVKEINEALKGIGNVNFGAKGSNDGGVVKQTKAQNDFTDAVKKSTNEIKNQGKQGEMSLDQIQGALQMAMREVRKWESHKTFSTQDLDKYQASLARVVELNEKLKRAKGGETYTRFDELSKKTAFDAKATIRDLTAVDDRLKQLNKYYKEEEKQAQKATAAIKENTQAKKENASVGQTSRPARDSYIAFMQGYKQQAEQIRRLMEEEQKAMQQRRQGAVDGFSKTIEERKARVKELSEEIAKLYKERPDGYRDATQQRRDEMNALKQKIRELTEAQKNLANSPIGASNRYLELEKEYNRIKNIMIDTTNVQRQSTQETERQAQSAQRYTEELKKQAAEIRKMPEWKQGNDIRVPTPSGYDAVVNSQRKLSLEEQLLQVYKQQEGQESQLSRFENTQNALANERLRTEQAITQEVEKRGKKYVSPTINDDAYQFVRNAVARKLGIDTSNVINADAQYDSIKRVSGALKQLQDAYARMTNEERNSPIGKQMIRQMQELERQTQQLRKQMSRPISLKDAMGLSEKTLDDIAYKMQRLSSFRSGLNVDTQKKEIQQVNDEYNRLKKRMDEVMQKNQQLISSNNALGRSWNYMKNRLAFYFTVGASTQFVKNLIEVRSQYEMNERALGILINSAERGTQIFNELSQMALVSPYTLIELSAAAKQLTAYDVAAKDVVDTTRRLADMAAAVGIPIERLTYALGQVKAYGYLNARDARMFANAGIPLVKQLSDYYTELEGRLVSTADIYDRIKKKQIGYEEVMSTISKMTDEGGKFYDFQAKMAETLKVQLANLTLAWNNMLNAMGEESQGVLVGGISTLKQLFLHWKDIEHVLYELVVALGAYKAYQIITTRLIGATSASLDAQVLAMKRNNAAMLKKQALTRTLTADEMNQVAAQKMVTAADYQNALSGKQLTKQKALLLVALNKNNVQLKAAVVNMGLLTTQEVANITTGKALAIVFKSIGISMKNAALAMKAFAASMWPLLVVGAIYELYHAWDSYGEHVKEVNKQAAEHAKEAFENIKQYLESESTINTRQRAVYKEGNPLTDSESQKAWDEMREKIELSSSASNTFIAKLMRINNINERLSDGFGYLEEIQRVAGVMQTLEKDAVDVSSTSLGGLFGEGLKDDLTDFISAYQKYVSLNENLRQGGVGEKYFNKQKKALEEFRGEVEKTTTSLYNIASKEGFNTNEQREFFEREISEIAQAEQMGAKETRIFRMQAEKEYYTYARAQLVAQLEYQQGAQKAATEKRIKDLDNEFGKNKALQESFFTWLTEKQDHAVKTMLRGKTLEEIKQGEWLKGANAKWVEEITRKFSKEYGVSFDGLYKLVMDANTWHINIPVFFQTIGQPLTDVQRDYEVRTGKKFSSNPIIKDAKSQVEILDILKKKQKEVAAEMETAEKAGGKYWEANKERYKEENDALVADIHAYNALTDAEEKSSKKKGSKKDPLLDALKQEISLVEKLQSDYDKLSKSGASQVDALDTIRGAYGKTIRLLNAQLGKYGLPQLNISQLITGKAPHKALEHFKQTLDTLVSKGLLTLERSKEIEAVVDKFTLSAKTYDLGMITKGLNNELGKLKDEYELAVELDANPELGDIFADMFGINTSTLPKTFGDALDRAQTIINRKLAEMNITTPFDLMDGNIDSFAKSTGLDKDSAVIKELVSAQNTWRDMFKKNITETEKILDDYIKKYGDYSDKIAEIEASRLEKLKKLNEAYYTEEMRKRPEYIAKLNAIEQGASKEKQQVDFDDFKNSRYYTMMFENLDYISTKTIRDMRDRVRDYIDTAKDLTPEQLKTLISQYEKLEQKVVKRSPFKTLAKDLKAYFKESKNRKDANAEFRNAQKEYDAQKKNVAALKEKYEQAKANSNTSQSYLDFLQIEIDGENDVLKILKEQLDAAEKKADKYNLTAKLAKSEASQVAQVIATNLKGIAELRDQLNELFGIDASKGETLLGHKLDGVIDGLSRVSDGINNAVSSAQSGNTFGFVSGVVDTFVGIGDSIASIFDGGSAKTRKLNRQINESKEIVRQLSMAYDDLERAISMSLGTGEIEARRLAIANKEAQLSEMERQMTLEQSKRSKDRDDDAIKQYEEAIHSLRNEIEDLKEDVINNLWGEDVKSAAEAFVDTWVSAWKAGKTTLKDIKDEMNDIMLNIVKKGVSSKIVEGYLSPIYKELDSMTKEGSLGGVALTNEELKAIANMSKTAAVDINDALKALYGQLNLLGVVKPDNNLSALQQGIQGITEDTAGALEAITNGISQQSYLQSDLLTQIRDAVVGFNLDVSLDVQSQMLLQLQNSYQTQHAIQQILEGVLNPSGRAFSVELIN